MGTLGVMLKWDKAALPPDQGLGFPSHFPLEGTNKCTWIDQFNAHQVHASLFPIPVARLCARLVRSTCYFAHRVHKEYVMSST